MSMYVRVVVYMPMYVRPVIYELRTANSAVALRRIHSVQQQKYQFDITYQVPGTAVDFSRIFRSRISNQLSGVTSIDFVTFFCLGNVSRREYLEWMSPIWFICLYDIIRSSLLTAALLLR